MKGMGRGWVEPEYLINLYGHHGTIRISTSLRFNVLQSFDATIVSSLV